MEIRKQIAQGSALATVGSLIAVGLGYISTFVVVRLVSVETYGEYQLALSLVSVLEKFVLLGLPFAIIRYVAQRVIQNDLQGIRVAISSGFQLIVINAVILILLSWVVLFSISPSISPFPQKLIPILQIASLLIVINPLKEISIAVLRGLKKIDLKVAAEDIWMPVSKLLLVVVVLSLFPNSIALVTSHMASIIVCILLVLHFLVVQRAWRLRDILINSAETKRILLRFSLPLLGSNLANTILTQVDRILLGILAGTSAVGIYSAAHKVAALIVFPYAGLALIFEPIIAQLYANRRITELSETFKFVTVWCLRVTLPISLLLIIFGREILTLFGPTYASGYSSLILLVVAQTIQTGFGHGGQMLVMTGRVQLDLAFMGISALLSIILSYILIKVWGITGAALAVALTFFFANMLATLMIWATLRIHPFKFQLIKALIAGMAAFVPSYILHHGLGWPLWADVPIVLMVFASCYLGTLWILHLDVADLSVLSQAWNWLKAYLTRKKKII